jgi:Flp pilus assembly protein TadG
MKPWSWSICMLNRLKRTADNESGVVLVLMAIMMTVFLGMGALAVDVGSFYQSQTQAQSAADSAALAAAQSLPGSTAAAKTTGTNFATTNYPGVTVNVTTPYNSSTTQVRVSVTTTTPAFFGKALGVTKANVSASAVASAATTGGAKSTIFAKGTSCTGTGIQLQAGNLTLNGGIISNGPMLASGHNNTFGSGTYGGPNNCSWTDNSGGDNTFGGSTSPTKSTTNQPWPEDYTSYFPVGTGSSDPFANDVTSNGGNCTFHGGDLNLQSLASTTMISGVYCYNSIEFNEANLTCSPCTFVAQSMQFNQGPDHFTPAFQNSLMFYDMETNPNLNANGTSFLSGGTDFFPNATNLTINAPSGTVSGFIEAQGVTVNGGGPTTWTGTGTPVGGSSTPPSLVQ